MGDLFSWEATMKGPEGSPYEGGTFKLKMGFPQEFPFKPPTVKFVTKMYHCNIGENGDVCMSLLRDGWSPAHRLDKVMNELQSLIACPNPDDPLNADSAALYRDNRAEYNRKAQECVRQHAKLEDTWSVRRTLSRLCLRIVFSVVTSDLLCRGPSMHQATPRTLRGQVIELAVDQ